MRKDACKLSCSPKQAYMEQLPVIRTTSWVMADAGSRKSGAQDSQEWCGFGSVGSPFSGDQSVAASSSCFNPVNFRFAATGSTSGGSRHGPPGAAATSIAPTPLTRTRSCGRSARRSAALSARPRPNLGFAPDFATLQHAAAASYQISVHRAGSVARVLK